MSPLVSTVVYYSTKSGNTRRFVERLGCELLAIPSARQTALAVSRPYILIVPTYGDGNPRTCVPGPVIRFLNHAPNRHWLQGVVAGGNTNFGSAFGLAGDVIAHKCNIPLLHKFELMGTAADVDAVTQYLTTESHT